MENIPPVDEIGLFKSNIGIDNAADPDGVRAVRPLIVKADNTRRQSQGKKEQT